MTGSKLHAVNLQKFAISIRKRIMMVTKISVFDIKVVDL